jgi:hypothetical protein
MRVWALLPLLASSGCLFLDSLNHPPSVVIEPGVTTTIKGGTITVRATASDPEDEPSHVGVSFHAFDANNQPLDQRCDYAATSYSQGPPQYNIRFFRTGIFRIEAIAIDTQGAMSGAESVMVTITDAPPVFATQAKVVPTSASDGCGLRPAGDVVTLSLAGGGVTDDDSTVRADDPSCPPAETLTYTWRISNQPSGTEPVLTLHEGSGCAMPTVLSGPTASAPDAMTQVCLWTDPMIVGATGMYSVVLEVSDGTTTTTGPAADVSVSPDEPPCITGTNPIAGSYVVDRTQLQEFDVDGVLDDRDTFGGPNLTFAWSVWRQTDPVWRAVPSWTLSTYQLDVSTFGVGEDVRVRVEAIDRTGALASPSVCPVDADDCVVYSCASQPNVCNKWKTWDLELR